jgi:hypothetical protein
VVFPSPRGLRWALLAGWLSSAGCGGLPTVNCSLDCPDGTRVANFESVARGDGVLVASAKCETYCEPTLRCEAPNVPTVTGEKYECKALDGYSDIPQDVDVDFAFAAAWNPDGPVVDACTDGVKAEDELDVDCGGACGPCATGQRCLRSEHCASGACLGERCSPASTTVELPLDPGTEAMHLASGDLDGDGDADLVVATASPPGILVYLNLGARTFAAPVAYATEGSPQDVSLVPLTAPERLDAVVSNMSSGTLSILPGLGDGTFGAASTHALGGSLYRTAVWPRGGAFAVIDFARGLHRVDRSATDGAFGPSMLLNEGETLFEVDVLDSRTATAFVHGGEQGLYTLPYAGGEWARTPVRASPEPVGALLAVPSDVLGVDEVIAHVAAEAVFYRYEAGTLGERTRRGLFTAAPVAFGVGRFGGRADRLDAVGLGEREMTFMYDVFDEGAVVAHLAVPSVPDDRPIRARALVAADLDADELSDLAFVSRNAVLVVFLVP